MTTSLYGKKGGTSRNAGRKAATFEIVAPDGQVFRKRTFDPDVAAASSAWAGVYWAAGSWHVAGLTVRVDELGRPIYGRAAVGDGQVTIAARRLDGDAAKLQPPTIDEDRATRLRMEAAAQRVAELDRLRVANRPAAVTDPGALRAELERVAAYLEKGALAEDTAADLAAGIRTFLAGGRQ